MGEFVGGMWGMGGFSIAPVRRVPDPESLGSLLCRYRTSPAAFFSSTAPLSPLSLTLFSRSMVRMTKVRVTKAVGRLSRVRRGVSPDTTDDVTPLRSHSSYESTGPAVT